MLLIFHEMAASTNLGIFQDLDFSTDQPWAPVANTNFIQTSLSEFRLLSSLHHQTLNCIHRAAFGIRPVHRADRE